MNLGEVIPPFIDLEQRQRVQVRRMSMTPGMEPLSWLRSVYARSGARQNWLGAKRLTSATK